MGSSHWRDAHGWLSDPMEALLRRLYAERCLPRRTLNAASVEALRLRCLVAVARGFVELTEIGRLAGRGLAARDALAATRRQVRADRSGGGPLAAVEVRHA